MPRPKDRFYDYLDYCDTVEIIGVGDYVEKFAPKETLAWTRLTRDTMDTYKAGKLRRVITKTGSAAYVRPDCAKLLPSDSQSNKQEGISNEHV